MSAVSACTYRLYLDECPASLEKQSGAWRLLSTVVETCPARPEAVSWVGRQWSVRRVLMLREMLSKQPKVSGSLVRLVDDLKRGIADDDRSLCWTDLHSDFSYYADREDAGEVERCVARACMGEILTWGFGVPSGLAQAIEGAALAANANSGSSADSHLSLEAIGLSTLISEARGNRLSDVLGEPRRRALLPADLDRYERLIVRHCRVCGCTDEDCSGCLERTGEPCYWVEEDLCSACCEDAD